MSAAMIQMLSAFNLPAHTDFGVFSARYDQFVDDLTRAGLVVGSTPVAVRVTDTPKDTDDANPRRSFTLMRFRNRTQLDAAYAQLKQEIAAHNGVYALVKESVFTCWELNYGR